MSHDPPLSPSSPTLSSDSRPASHHSPRYRGVRKRKWGKWVAEIREPHKRSRIWLGSYFSAQAAAVAFDVAAYCLRGASANMNLPHLLPQSVRTLPCTLLSPKSVQKLALAAGSMADHSAAADSFGAINSPSSIRTDAHSNSETQSAPCSSGSASRVGTRREGSFTKPPRLSIAPIHSAPSSYSIKTSHNSISQAPAEHVAQLHWTIGAKLEISPNPTIAQLADAMLVAPPPLNEQIWDEVCHVEACDSSLWQF